MTERPDEAGSARSRKERSALAAGLTRRMCQIFEGHTNEDVAVWTEVSSETIRRYRLGHVPPADFVARLCEARGVCDAWLATGQGPRLRKDAAGAALAACTTPELLAELARRLADAEAGEERVGQGRAA